MVSLNKALLGPYFLGGGSFGGGTLGSHQITKERDQTGVFSDDGWMLFTVKTENILESKCGWVVGGKNDIKTNLLCKEIGRTRIGLSIS